MKIFNQIAWLLVKISKSIINLILSIALYKTFRLHLSNHLTIGIAELHKKRVSFPHPVGIVIGQKVTIGYNCTIYQNVTIGTKDTKNYNAAKYPIIGNNVTIYANSIIFGAISIGDNSIIGAGSVVFTDIPANSIVVGNPAKILNSKENHQVSNSNEEVSVTKKGI